MALNRDIRIEITGKRVLLADDDDSLRSGLAAALRERGYDAFEARRGGEALDLGTRIAPDLGLLDMNMPDMTGVEVFRRWIALGIRFPVIFMTAEATAELRVEAVRLGAIEVLPKPFGVRQLFGLVSETVSGRYRRVEDQ